MGIQNIAMDVQKLHTFQRSYELCHTYVLIYLRI
jgi:hypothetical protein